MYPPYTSLKRDQCFIISRHLYFCIIWIIIVIKLKNVKYSFRLVKGTLQFSIWFENKSSNQGILEVTLLITSANYSELNGHCVGKG